MTKNEEKLLKRMADAAFDTVGEHVRSIDSLSKRISELEKDKRSEVNKKWVYLHMSKIYGRIQGLKKNAESMKTNIQRKGINFAEHQMYNESEFKKIHDRISHAFDRLDQLTIDCAATEKDVNRLKNLSDLNPIADQIKSGRLKRRVIRDEERISILESQVNYLVKLRDGSQGDPVDTSKDNKYRCPLCGSPIHIGEEFRMTCLCGTKLQLVRERGVLMIKCDSLSSMLRAAADYKV